MCMVGDRLDTDMLFAKENNFRSLLVLTGITSASGITKEDEALFESKFDSLAEVIEYDRVLTGG